MNSPFDEWEQVELLWRASAARPDAQPDRLATARWVAAMKAEARSEEERARRFYWAAAAALILGWHVALAASWASGATSADASRLAPPRGGFTAASWRDMTVSSGPSHGVGILY